MTFQRPSSEGDQGSSVATPTGQSTVARIAALAAPPVRSGTIERLVYRSAAEAWPDGAAPFVRWLHANPDVVGDLLGSTLTAVAEEVPGSDACLFQDSQSRRLLVVVEMGESSEGTFGALVTRLTATQAPAALWICGSVRPEHSAAISWLNRSVDARLYVARLRAARIGASPPAPALEVVLRPPRSDDASSNGPAGSPDQARRAGDWGEIILGEPSA
ncbi:MAG: hypothetical protein ACRDGJ_05960 [Candidatus Limnocylindria bacterium]